MYEETKEDKSCDKISLIETIFSTVRTVIRDSLVYTRLAKKNCSNENRPAVDLLYSIVHFGAKTYGHCVHLLRIFLYGKDLAQRIILST